MNTSLSKFKTGARAAIAGALLAASMAAVPSPALAGSSITLDLGGGGLTFDFDVDIGPDHCADRGEIREILRDIGFYDIVFTSYTSSRATVRAYHEEEDEDDRFRVRMDRCPFDITSVRRIF
jgi:hypothetical protein